MTGTRDVEAVIKASNYVRHGTTFLGGSFTACSCPKQACGGVAEPDQDHRCPEHSREPAQLWHWASECPALCGRTESVSGQTYPSCTREAGHREAYCRSADGNAYFLAVDRSRMP